jgi:RNA polymerase sigma-70 factor (ECF subfamily)
MVSTSASLLERLREPDAVAAWRRFADLYSPLLYHWATRLGHQNADADDIVQDLFVVLYRKLPEFEYDSSKSFRAWLKTILINRSRRYQREKAPAMDMAWQELADPAGDSLDEQEYRQYLLHRALELIEREFSPLQRRAFHEYVLNDRPVEEVSRGLELSVANIYCIKSRILNRLRQEIRHLID